MSKECEKRHPPLLNLFRHHVKRIEVTSGLDSVLGSLLDMAFIQKILASLTVFLGLLIASHGAYAAAVTLVPHSALVGGVLQSPPPPAVGNCTTSAGQCDYQAYDLTGNIAYQGGVAANSVTSSTIANFGTIHNSNYVNDGFYGNGRSWIPDGADSTPWIKIDLGQNIEIDRLMFGRDRLDNFNDRSPGQFTIEIATTDDVYANGNDGNDGAEYTQILDSALLGFSGILNTGETVEASFTAVTARYVKINFGNSSIAIDEVEVFEAAIPEPAALAIFIFGLAGLGYLRRNRFLN